MNFNESKCTVERSLNGEKLVKKLRGRMLDYPVAILTIGGDKKTQKEFTTWLSHSLPDVTGVKPLRDQYEIDQFSKARNPVDVVRFEIVVIRESLGASHDVRHKVVEQLYAWGFKQVMLIWLRPNESIPPSVLQSTRCADALAVDHDIDCGDYPTSEGVDYYTTLVFDPEA